jgi:hypothetical protein
MIFSNVGGIEDHSMKILYKTLALLGEQARGKFGLNLSHQ